MNTSKDLIFKLNDINRDVIHSIIHKIRLLFSDIFNIDSLHSYPWAFCFINEHFSSLLGNIVFWFKVYNTYSPGEELSMIHFEKKKCFIVYIVLLAAKGYLDKIIRQTYKRITEVISSKYPKATSLLSLINLFLPSDQTINDFNMMYFLFNNSHKYNIIEKILNISYLNSIQETNIYNTTIIFKAISSIIAIRLISKLIDQITISIKILSNKSLIKVNENKINEHDKILKLNKANKENVCLICLDNYKDVSSTICGHLFCWKCIIEYLESNSKCPKCRRACYSSQVIYLQNY